MIDFEFLFHPVEDLDQSLTNLFEGVPLLVALAIAFVLGLRHASDPDHLVAVTSLVASKQSDHRDAARLGAWWGLGHATILLLAGRVIWKWARGDYRLGKHRHPGEGHRHLSQGDHHDHVAVRTPAQAYGIGVLHGLAGTGAVVVLLIAALPSQLEAAAAMAVFAPMSIVSMAACTAAFAWVLTRPIVEPVYRAVVIPALGLFGVLFGLWYVGLT